jgi:hypothetical protein
MATYTGIYFSHPGESIICQEFKRIFGKTNWESLDSLSVNTENKNGAVVFGVEKYNGNWNAIILPDFCIDPHQSNPLINIEEIAKLSSALNCNAIIFSSQSITDYCYWCYLEKGTIRRLHSSINDDDELYKINSGTPFGFEKEIKDNDPYWKDVSEEIKSNAICDEWAEQYCEKLGLNRNSGLGIKWFIGK